MKEKIIIKKWSNNNNNCEKKIGIMIIKIVMNLQSEVDTSTIVTFRFLFIMKTRISKYRETGRLFVIQINIILLQIAIKY